MEGEEDCADEEARGDGVVPAQVLAEIEGDEDAEDDERNHFLNDLELHGGEAVCADAIGWDLEAVFKQGNGPTDEDHFPERLMAKAEVTVPGEGHEDVGDDEQDDSPHISILDAFGRGAVLELWLGVRAWAESGER